MYFNRSLALMLSPKFNLIPCSVLNLSVLIRIHVAGCIYVVLCYFVINSVNAYISSITLIMCC